MWLSFRFSRPTLPKQDIFCVLVLVSVVAFTRITLLINSPSMYFFDSYVYVNRSLDLVHNGQITFGPSIPFILTLSFFLQLFSWLATPVSIVQSVMISFSIMTILILYLIGKKMAGTLFAFFTSILAAFEQYFLSFSIVGHNDVFAIAMGLASFYFVTATKKLHYVITPFLFYIAVGTRPELYPVFVVPIVIFNFYKNWASNLRQKILLTIYLIVVYVLPALWIYTILPSYTRFSPIQRIILFLNPELIGVALTSIFTFYSQDLLNNIFLLFCFLGVLIWFASTLGDFVISKRSENSTQGKLWFKEIRKFIRRLLKSESVVIGVCTFLIFGIYVVILVTYGFGYTIIGDQLTVIKTLPERYLILPRLLLCFSLVYPLYLCSVWIRDKLVYNQ